MDPLVVIVLIVILLSWGGGTYSGALHGSGVVHVLIAVLVAALLYQLLTGRRPLG